MATSQELLDAVNTAILEIVQTGVSFFGGAGKQYTVNDLEKLRLLRSELTKEVAASSGSSFRLAGTLRRR